MHPIQAAFLPNHNICERNAIITQEKIDFSMFDFVVLVFEKVKTSVVLLSSVALIYVVSYL